MLALSSRLLEFTMDHYRRRTDQSRHRRGLSRRRAIAPMLLLAATAGVARTARAYTYDTLSNQFTFCAIPDPQYYSVVQWKTDDYYKTQMQWIVNHAGAQNVAFVYGLGDEVQDGNPFTTDANHNITTTYSYNITPSGQAQQVAGAPSIDTVDPVNHDFEAEWKRASSAWQILDTAGIPNYAGVGNHDYYHWDQKRDPNFYL